LEEAYEDKEEVKERGEDSPKAPGELAPVKSASVSAQLLEATAFRDLAQKISLLE